MNLVRATSPVRQGAARLSVWFRDTDGRREERAASSLVVFIMFFPLVVGAFGFGIDLARNVWIRNSIQNAVDSSVVGGAGTTLIDHAGAVVINQPQAKIEMRKLYAINRGDNPGLTCIGDQASITANGRYYVRCWQEPVPPATTTRTAQFDVREQSRNAFMGLLGMPTQDYNLRGKAKINQTTQ